MRRQGGRLGDTCLRLETLGSTDQGNIIGHMRCPSCGSRNRAVRGTCTVCNTVLPTDPALTQAATELPADVSPSDDAVTVTVRPSVPDRLRPDDPDADETRVPRRARAPVGPLTVGEAFGSRYKIVKVLGVGGMGAVYKAWDQELGVSVALKVIRAEVMEDPFVARELELRFKRELLLGRKVTHKNVVRIHDIGEIRGIKYITMPYIEGSDLATILKREGKLPVRRALRIARSVASGLAAAHEAGVVHRDLKPANIMVDAEDEPYITDFGIARSSSAQAAAGGVGKQNRGGTEAESQWLSGHTMAGTVVGTIEYMAPEQAKGEQVDGQADVYAFGLILYDVLVGRPRRKGFTSPKEELTSRMQAAPPAVRTIEGSVPEPLDRIVSKCLEPDRNLRYRSTAELVAELDRLDEEGQPLPLLRRFSPMQVGAAITGLAAAFALVSWLAWPVTIVQPDPLSVLTANFENSTGDPIFEGVLEEELNLGMEGASFINAFSRANARQITEQTNPGSAFDESAARLIALREGIDVILAGSIAPSNQGYEISVRALDPALDGPESTLAMVEAAAATRDDVLPAMGPVAEELRRLLGDTSPASTDAAAAETFTAASLEAANAYAGAQELAFRGAREDALAAYQRAVALDPNLGRAYSGAAIVASELGRDEEATVLWEQALALMNRMTERTAPHAWRLLSWGHTQLRRSHRQLQPTRRAVSLRSGGAQQPGPRALLGAGLPEGTRGGQAVG